MRSSKINRFIASVLIVLAIAGAPLRSMADTMPGATNCPSGTFATVLMNFLDTLHNIFPLKIGGVTVLNFGNENDYDDSGAGPVCICEMPPPIFVRVGIPIHFWEPPDVIETVQQPWCSPTLGINLALGFNKFAIGGESDMAQQDKTATSQAHLISYPIWWMIGIFVDLICFQAATGFDYLYVTELDPLWQNDLWASILSPEASLFANPIAQLACPIDCVTTTLGYPIDYLMWCQGCWNGNYPIAQHANSVDYVQANAGIAGKFIYKLHRELVLWLTSGPMMLRGYCQAFPFPIEKKTQYNLLPIYPFRNENRMAIGTPSLLWSPGKQNPFQTNYVWVMYRVRDCCAF